MNINPAASTNAAASVGKLQAARKAYDAPPPTAAQPRAADRLELSGASHLLELAKANDVRMEKVAALKAQIEAGTYDLDAKADAVADRLLDDLEM